MRKLLSLFMAAVMLFAVASNLFACTFEMRNPMNPTANPNRGEKVTSDNHYVENVKPRPQDTEKEPYRPETAEPERPAPEPVVEYMVSFVLEGSDYQPEPQFVAHGEYAQKPDTSFDANTRFDGVWYLDPSCNKEYRYDFDRPVYENLTLYARVEVAYTVTFVVQGNTDQPEEQKVWSGEYAQYPDFIVDKYCTFDGNWYLDPSYNELYQFDIPVTGDLVLYARVERSPLAPAWITESEDIFNNAMLGMLVQVDGIFTEGTYEFVRMRPTGADPYFQVAQELGYQPRYMAISYRTNSSVEGQFFIGSGAGPNGQEDYFNYDWVEGGWQLAIIDLEACGLKSITDNIINYLRMDFFINEGAPGDYFDLEYVAFFDSPWKAEEFYQERHKAPMWDEMRDVVAHRSFDELDMYAGEEKIDGVFTPGQSESWNHIVNCDASVNELRYWGWACFKGKVGQFGYQIDGGAPVYDDRFAVEAEQPILDAANGLNGADNASRMEIMISLVGLLGSHTVRTLYMTPNGEEVCLDEFTVNVESGGYTPEIDPTQQGLYFVPNGDGTCYVAGLGSSTETKIVIPREYQGMPVVGIGESAFAGCKNITTISIPDSVNTIGQMAFADCSGLVSVALPKTITEIPLAAFCGCASLKSLRIPEGVTFIDIHAFAECTSLKTLTLPKGLKVINDYVLQNCYNLTYVNYSGSEEDWYALTQNTDLGVNVGAYTVRFGYAY